MCHEAGSHGLARSETFPDEEALTFEKGQEPRLNVDNGLTQEVCPKLFSCSAMRRHF